jgi:hypothetical protein
MDRVWVSSYYISLLGIKIEYVFSVYLIKNEIKISHFEILKTIFKGQIQQCKMQESKCSIHP